MKARGIFVFVALAFLASPAWGQVFARPPFATPNGEKKIGQYVWVWRTEKIPVGPNKQVEVDCPTGDVVTGGGYKPNTVSVYESAPTPGFDGWMVYADTAYKGPNTVTVYAGCVPAS